MSEPTRDMLAGRQPAGRKRFWKEVDVVQEAEGFAVRLDGRAVRLPAGTALSVPSRALAEALAAEWRAAGLGESGRFVPADLPLTGIAGSMLERIPQARDGVIQSLLAYANSDLLCYRDAAGSALARQQAEVWDPLLQQLEAAHGCRLTVTSGVMPICQTDDVLRRLHHGLDTSAQEELAVLGVVVPALGSLALGLLMFEAGMEAQTLVHAATLDEQIQMATWGVDTEVTDRIAALQDEVGCAMRFLALYRQG